MEKRVIVVCLVIGFLGLLCAVTGFAAEATRFKGDARVSSNRCSYNRTPAYGLGLTAAIAMLIAQIVTSAASRCTCCCSKGPHRSKCCWTVALICFVLSWIATVLAFPVLLAAAILNDSYTVAFGREDTSCLIIASGVFAGATVLSLASITLGLIYYIILSSDDKPLLPNTNQDGVVMGQPQFPTHQ